MGREGPQKAISGNLKAGFFKSPKAIKGNLAADWEITFGSAPVFPPFFFPVADSSRRSFLGSFDSQSGIQVEHSGFLRPHKIEVVNGSCRLAKPFFCSAKVLKPLALTGQSVIHCAVRGTCSGVGIFRPA